MPTSGDRKAQSTETDLSGLAGPYAHASALTGPLVDSDRVEFREAMSTRQRLGLACLILLNIVFGLGFVVWLLLPSHLPTSSDSVSTFALISGYLALALIVAVEFIRVLQTSALWLFATALRDPVPIVPKPGRAAVLTTIVPSKEPLELVLRTLRAMKRLEHDGPLDVWILDEGNDPNVRRAVEEIGVKHFSRKGEARWNTESGAFKARPRPATTMHGETPMRANTTSSLRWTPTMFLSPTS